MRNFLTFLLLLSAYVAANTCTEAYFKAKANALYPVEGEPQIDSIYEKVSFDRYQSYELAKKYYYHNKIIERIESVHIGDVVDTTAYNFYHSLDEKVLSKKGVEILFSDSAYKDTLIFIQKVFEDGLFFADLITKIAKNYTSQWERDYLSGVLNEDTYGETVLRNDSVIVMQINDDNTDHPSTSYWYVVENSSDDHKCEQYFNDKDNLSYEFVYKKTDNGFVFEEKNGGMHYRQVFMLYHSNDEITAIKKRRPVTNISTKARYFDLLGRYKYVR